LIVLNNPLERFWLYGRVNSPYVTYEEFMEYPEDVRNALVAARLLEEGPAAQDVLCEICEDYAGEVRQIDYADGRRRFLTYCPECGSDEIHPDRMRQWFPKFGKAAEWLHQSLDCQGAVQEIVSGLLWNVGRSAIAGQSRPIWMAKAMDDSVQQALPSGKLPILFLVAPPYRRTIDFEPDRIFEMEPLTTIENELLQFDTDAVRAQIESVTTVLEPSGAAPRKDSKRASAIRAAKKELHEHILSMKSLLANTYEDLPRLTQNQLGDLIGESKVMVSRILKEPDPDLHLQILWQTANDPDMIRQYKRMAG
jgi:hypothetical protein